jgi:uncharacterized protein (TIGR00255 family)
MTGFGSGSAESGRLRVDVEIKGVNNRYLDVRVRLPAELSGLEADLRQRVQASVARGRVDAVVVVSSDRDGSVQLDVRQPLIEQYLKAAGAVKRRHRLRGTLSVDQVFSLPGVVQVVPEAPLDPQAAAEAVRLGFDRALAGFAAMRRDEGARLATDLKTRLATIAADVDAIAREAETQPTSHARRLRDRLEGLLGEAPVDPARLAQEVALLAERFDISEELVRLRGYIEQTRGALERPEGPVGKTLDFVMQEMNREANTIASKSESLPICQAALRVRATVEAVREQVQNLE